MPLNLKEGTISLSVESNDRRQAVVSVKDNGQGIDPSIPNGATFYFSLPSVEPSTH